MEIVFIGAGRLATQLAQSLAENGHRIMAVYSRTLASAETLAGLVGARATDEIASLPTEADAFIIAVKDGAIATLVAQLAEGRAGQTFLHTAGSVPMQVLAVQGVSHYGVFYPMQTFSKERRVDFSRIPVFIEGSDAATLDLLRTLAASVSRQVTELSSEARRHLHLAAVFASNFTNHCYALAAEVLSRHGLPFSVMLPLIDETAAKVHDMLPADAQTGPAVRYDTQVIEAQSQLLAALPQAREVYDVMSKSIHGLRVER
jgi:predicted short-subunit dehydrogenase-like oxidoreductase (DUF2520 family)